MGYRDRLPNDLTERDVADTIASFRTYDFKKSVKKFQAHLPSAVSDRQIRKRAFEKVNKDFGKFRVLDLELERKLKARISPVLKLYGRENAYDLYIFRNKSPYIVNQSGVLLVMTTGLLNEIETDDELLGAVAHEIGHDYFSEYSKYSEHLFLRVKLNGKEKALLRQFENALAIIELQCDAFSAITMAYLGYNPYAFTEFVEQISARFPVDPKAYHPTPKMRREVVLGVVPKSKIIPAQGKNLTRYN